MRPTSRAALLPRADEGEPRFVVHLAAYPGQIRLAVLRVVGRHDTRPFAVAARRAVDQLPNDVGVAGVPGRVEQHGEQHPAQRHRYAEVMTARRVEMEG